MSPMTDPALHCTSNFISRHSITVGVSQTPAAAESRSSFLRLVIISPSAVLGPESLRRRIEGGNPPSLPEKKTLTNGGLILLHLHFGRTTWQPNPERAML